MPDERERRSLGPVNQLVGERDRERDGENGKRRPSTSSETHGAMVRPMVPHVTAVSASPPVLDPPDQPQARPVFVDGGHLDVDQPDGQRLVPDEVFGDVAAMPGRAPRPGDPECPGRIYPAAELADLRGDVGRLGEERHDDVGLPVRAGPGQPVRRAGQRPAVRRLVQADPLSRLEAQLGRLGRPEYPGVVTGPPAAPMSWPARARLSP